MSDIKPSSLKVVDLRAELSKRGLSTKGKKDELVARLTEALATDNDSSNNQPAIEELKEVEEKEAASAVEEQQEQAIQEITDTITTNKDTAQDAVVEESKEEQLIVQPAEEIIVRPAEEVIEKPAEEIVEEPAEDVTAKLAEDVVEKPAEEVIVQVTELVAEKTQEEVVEKADEQVIEKPQEQLIERPDEQMIEKPQEELIPKPDEQLIEAQTNDSDSGLKRKRLENDAHEDEKRLKTVQETTSEVTSGTASLYIKGFVRPLIIKHVQELLAKYGTVKRFWMDSIKTHCYVTVSSSVLESLYTKLMSVF
ncbi:hypothetical protein G6F42_017189 [Rhizopus arrhizus]|nr:hypothetical protein G6F42_017189 [Rhizopus arrhizus]